MRTLRRCGPRCASTGLLDSVAATAGLAATTAAFDRSTAYELAFWEMAYTWGASDGFA